MKTRIKNLLLLPALTAGLGLTLAGRVTAQTLTTLYSFTATSTNGWNDDGANPIAALILSSNTLCGTAYAGGGSGLGTVFKLDPDGAGFTILHSFTALTNGTNSDGANPRGSLVVAGDTLYATAMRGGNSVSGTVFAVNTNGTGFTNLHSLDFFFDGNEPQFGLV